MKTLFGRPVMPCLVLASVSAVSRAAEKLFAAEPLTQAKEFTTGIEGPACDGLGNIYAVNLKERGTIGVVTPPFTSTAFSTELPETSSIQTRGVTGVELVLARKKAAFVS